MEQIEKLCATISRLEEEINSHDCGKECCFVKLWHQRIEAKVQKIRDIAKSEGKKPDYSEVVQNGFPTPLHVQIEEQLKRKRDS